MNAVVLGYREFGCAGLAALLRHGFDVKLVVTHPDSPSEVQAWPSLADRAVQSSIPVFIPESASSGELLARVRELAPDFLFSFYYRYLLPDDVLRCARTAAINLHGSLLPKLRGRAPLNWALVLGESVTGVSLHHMTGRADAGDIVDQEPVPIGPVDTAYTLSLKLLSAGDLLLERTLPRLKAGTATRTPQDLTLGSYVGARTPEDGRLDWTRSTAALFNLVRAVTHPYPGAFTEFEGRRLFVWWALPREAKYDAAPGTVVEVNRDAVVVATVDGALSLITLQRSGEPQSPASALAPLIGLRPGSILGGVTA
jgi:UDP-4-amino-4-deoxy-L-arabinose formyltransferase/UDP-glucuronic acid dehydrogenase (UDP-4-keto-hexauronic acid decarboxylating)